MFVGLPQPLCSLSPCISRCPGSSCSSRGILQEGKWVFKRWERHFPEKCDPFSAVQQTLGLWYSQKISCMLHPFHTSPWNLHHFKLYNSKIICYPFSDQFKKLSLKRSWLIRDDWWTWTGGCVCVCIWSSFVLSWLALVVKTAVLVISWLALQGKKSWSLLLVEERMS